MEDFCKITDGGKERVFNFKAPTAWDGAAIFNYLMSYGLPFRPKAKAMPPEDLEKLMQICLKNCYEHLPGAEAPVVDASGNIGIITNGQDAPMLTQIAVKYMLFFMEWWKGASV